MAVLKETDYVDSGARQRKLVKKNHMKEAIHPSFHLSISENKTQLELKPESDSVLVLERIDL